MRRLAVMTVFSALLLSAPVAYVVLTLLQPAA